LTRYVQYKIIVGLIFLLKLKCYNHINLLQLGCYPVTVVILHVYKT